MAKGDGSITEVKKPDGTSYAPKHWKVRIDLGTNPITGKRDVVSRNIKGTKSDACKLRDQLKADLECGLSANADKMTFAEFAEQWQQARETAAEISKTRLRRERTIVEDMCSYIGGIKLRDITAQTIEGLYMKMRWDKTEEKGKCSGTTMNMIHKLLKQILSRAVDYDLILRNPAEKVKAPRCDTPDRRSLTTAEARRLLATIDEAEDEAYASRDAIEERQERRGDTSERSYLRGLSSIGNVMAARIGLATGMRRGEVLGLTWGHISFARGTIRVTQSVTTYGEVKEPKTEAGKRVIAVDEKTIEHLRRWKQFQREELAILSLEQTRDTPVCCNDKGGLIAPTNFSRWWRSFTKAHGFEGLKFHELRHTQATQLVAGGMDMKTVQHRLGHASATLTMNLYAHALPENDAQAAQLIGSLFSETPSEQARQEGALRVAV